MTPAEVWSDLMAHPDEFPDGMLSEIALFLAHDCERSAGMDLYLDVFRTNFFFPLQRQGELAAMMRLARVVEPKVVMEIGADKGGSLYHWCKCLPTVKRVIACEIRGTPYARFFSEAFPHIQFCWLSASSYDYRTVTGVRTWLGGDPIDCLFIDGDKGAFDVDFDCYTRRFPMANNLVFMHDIQDELPGNAFWRCAEPYGHTTVIDLADTQVAMKRAKEGLPVANPHEGWLRHWEGRSCGLGVIYLKEKSA